jgi:hypothetical protein
MSIFGRRLDADKLAELGKTTAKTEQRDRLAKDGKLDNQRRSYVIRVHTSDGRNAQAWGGLTTGRNVRKMADRLAVEGIGELVRDVSKLWSLGLDDHARIQEITIEAGPDLNNPTAP